MTGTGAQDTGVPREDTGVPREKVRHPPAQHDADRGAYPTAGRWIVDPARSSISFLTRHLLVSRVRGVFTSFSGTITIGEDLADTSLEAEAHPASVQTGDTARDDHLRSPDFFDVERWSLMRLTGSGLHRDDNSFLLDTQLTIRDQTQPVLFRVTVAPGSDRAPNRARFTARSKVNRKDFGLRWNSTIEAGGVVVADVVELVLEVEAVLEGAVLEEGGGAGPQRPE